MSPRAPVTRPASSERSYALSALLYAVRNCLSAVAASPRVEVGSTSRSPCTTTQPLAVNDNAVTEAAISTLRSSLRSLRGPRSLLIRCLHLPLPGGEPYRGEEQRERRDQVQQPHRDLEDGRVGLEVEDALQQGAVPAVRGDRAADVERQVLQSRDPVGLLEVVDAVRQYARR